MTTPSGFLLVDKPSGITSALVSRRIARLAGGIKAGHLGTLDPMATGLLVVCLGNALKLVPYLQKATKRYVARVRFGQATDTYDADGKVVAESQVPADLKARLLKALPRFVGEVDQTPPPYSAVKVQGQRLYKLARKGEEVNPPSRRVTFYAIEVTQCQGPMATLDVTCSAGTYIRSLAHDLGRQLRCHAHLAALRRSESHPFKVTDSVPWDELQEQPERIVEELLPLETGLPAFPRIVLSTEEERRVRHGQPLPAPDTLRHDGHYLLMDQEGLLVAIGVGDEERKRIKIRRVIST